jgi:hypothetical protein
MKLLDFLLTLVKGAYYSMVIERPAKVRKSYSGLSITKRLTTVVKVGIGYDTFKAVKEAREDGTLPKENAGLPWGEWAWLNPNGSIVGADEATDDAKSLYPYVITHKGGLYFRSYANLGQTKAEWFVGGEKVNKADIAPFLLSSETSDKEPKPIYPMSTKEVNIVSVGEWNASEAEFKAIEDEWNAYVESVKAESAD